MTVLLSVAIEVLVPVNIYRGLYNYVLLALFYCVISDVSCNP